jgi:hypothetical protein
MVRPWYELRIPGPVFDQFNALAAQAGAFAGLLHQASDTLRTRGPIAVTAWHASRTIAVLLIIVAVLVALVGARGLLNGEPLVTGGDTGVLALLGGIACALVFYRILHRPLPNQVLHLQAGIWLSLVGAATTVAGALCLRSRPQPYLAVQPTSSS